VPALTALIANGPFVGSTVTSVSAIHDTDGRQTFTTGAFNINLKTSGKAIPYVSAGGGFRANTGGTPNASLEGNYRFQTLGVFPMNETDSVTVRTSIRDGAVGVVGGGLKFFVSRRWGIRLDLRAFFGNGSTETLVNTNSRGSSASPAGVAASFGTP